MALRDPGITELFEVFRDLNAHPIPLPAMGHIPLSQVAPNPIQTLPGGSPSFSRLGGSSGKGCELPSLEGFSRECFFPPSSINPLSGRVLVSSTSSGLALTSIPEFPQRRCHPEPPLSPSQKLFLRRSFSVTRNEDPHEPHVVSPAAKSWIRKVWKMPGKCRNPPPFFLCCSKKKKKIPLEIKAVLPNFPMILFGVGRAKKF